MINTNAAPTYSWGDIPLEIRANLWREDKPNNAALAQLGRFLGFKLHHRYLSDQERNDLIDYLTCHYPQWLDPDCQLRREEFPKIGSLPEGDILAGLATRRLTNFQSLRSKIVSQLRLKKTMSLERLAISLGQTVRKGDRLGANVLLTKTIDRMVEEGAIVATQPTLKNDVVRYSLPQASRRSA